MNCTSNHSTSSSSSTCVLPVNFSNVELEDLFKYIEEIRNIEGISQILTGSIGIALNFTTIFVVLSSDLAASFFNWLLACLAIFDNSFLIVGILEGSKTQYGSSDIYRYLFVWFLHYFRSVTLCCSEYMTILLSLERYNALKTPAECYRNNSWRHYTLRNYFSVHKARLMKYIGPIVLFTSILYIPKFMEVVLVEEQICPSVNSSTNEICTSANNSTYEICPSVNNSSSLCVNKLVERESKLRTSDLYILWYLNVTNILITVAVPLSILIYLNLNIALLLKRHVDTRPELTVRREITKQENNMTTILEQLERKKVKRKERNMVQQTTMLFAIVILFLIFHTPRIILNMEEAATLKDVQLARKQCCVWMQYWTLILVPVSQLLLQVKSSINLFIYCMLNSLFRKALKRKLEPLIRSVKPYPIHHSIKSRSGVFQPPNCNLELQFTNTKNNTL